MKDDLKEYFPYKVIETYGAEGDDVIAVLARHLVDEPTVIVSGDKDFAQLLDRDNIKQYAPVKKKYIEVENAQEALRELIITGDKGDGIPNIKSDADTFMIKGKRQKSLKKTEIAQWKKMSSPAEFCESRTMLENHLRNKELIDFTHIPEAIRESILEGYNVEIVGSKTKLTKYFMDNKMRLLLKHISEF